MIPTIDRRSGLIRASERIRNWMGYRAFLQRHGLNIRSTSPGEKRLNRLSKDYPPNHRYSLHAGRLVPGFKLYERWWDVAFALPQRLESFLDIGCCRGFYVLQAAQRPGCRLALGVDVHEPFVSIARTVGARLGLANAVFSTVTLDQLAQDPAAYGGPFQVTCLLGAYHYLFWGSRRSDYALRSHERILACLAALTTDRLILSARLEMDRLPAGVKELARSSPQADVYNTRCFLKAAESFFDVEHAGYLGRYPLLVMHKKVEVLVGTPTRVAETTVAASA